MSEQAFAVLHALTDGKFHSGEAIAQHLGCSRTLVWQAVHTIEDAFDLQVHSVRGQGYKLAEPFEWLEVPLIRRFLTPSSEETWTVAVADEVDSTNTQLMVHANPDGVHGLVLAAERQLAGKGRLGRRWHARLGACLMFSLLWRFDRGLADLAGLSLTVGLALARVLRRLGAPVTLKWPNDLQLDGRKLAGILIELSGDALGLNLHPTANIDQPIAALSDCGVSISRNQLLALLLNELELVLTCFNQQGFAPFSEEWMSLSSHQDQPVRLLFSHADPVEGIARGVAENGTLLVETDGSVRAFHIGEVSLRRVE